MKTVLIIRHASSSPDTSGYGDFERTLSEKGRREALEMAEYLLQMEAVPELFISSPAKRAFKTVELLISRLRLSSNVIRKEDTLYLPAPSSILRSIQTVEDQIDHIAICSHNPAITQLVNAMFEKVSIDNMPPCGIFGIKTSIEKWVDFRKDSGAFWFFKRPGHFHFL